MKNNKFLTTIFAFIIAISFNSCVDDNDFTVPTALGSEENKALQTLLTEINSNTKSVISIANLKALFVPGQVTEITSDIVVKGYVSSSDKTGNFYKEFFIQDSPTNPTAGIRVATEFTDSYNKYNFGREVYINLKGLFIGEIRSGDDIVTIGGDRNTDNEVENLSLTQTLSNVLRNSNTEQMIPLTTTFSGINESKIGIFVEVNSVQFPTSLAGKTFVEATDQFDTQRILEACSGFGYANFILETSAFADFKFRTLPAGGGSINAVVAKTFNGSDMVLVLNDANDVKMDATGNRCSPLNIADFTTTLNEEFNNITTNWNAFSITGSETWGTTTFGNPGTAARISGFNNGAKDNEDWLVSKVINLSGKTDVYLTFETVKRFAGNDLELYYSTNYTSGSPVTNGTWVKLDFVLDSNINSWTSWTSSGAIDLGAAKGGNAYIAFKYTSTTSEAATYQIDNLKVLTK